MKNKTAGRLIISGSIIFCILSLSVYANYRLFNLQNSTLESLQNISFDFQDYKSKKKIELESLQEKNELLSAEFTDYKSTINKRIAMDPLKDLLTPDEIEELIKHIPQGKVFGRSFSVTAPFGESIGYHGNLREDHQGIDVTPDHGDWGIYPHSAGVVEEFGENRIYGKYIIIKHSEILYSFYGHLSKIFYSGTTGRTVNPDTLIGIMGNTGLSDGSHLHFEIRVWTGENMVAINSLPFMIRGKL